uniref:(northern house mosquito) hypothetical protein n=1 Tax=Culex pipiens TaxID=7175 RepID=A0A8D8BU95_CULPI
MISESASTNSEDHRDPNNPPGQHLILQNCAVDLRTNRSAQAFIKYKSTATKPPYLLVLALDEHHHDRDRESGDQNVAEKTDPPLIGPRRWKFLAMTTTTGFRAEQQSEEN